MTEKPPYDWMSSEYEYVWICGCDEKEVFHIKKDGKTYDVIIVPKKRR